MIDQSNTPEDSPDGASSSNQDLNQSLNQDGNQPGSNPWSPDQYARFRAERRQPFFDLVEMVQPAHGMRVADLGCGTGINTEHLHSTLNAEETLGIDSSATMLEKAAEYANDNISFQQADLRNLQQFGKFDLIFSNAALHWVEDHSALFQQLSEQLTKNGQLAVQMPDQGDHPSHYLIRELACEEPYASHLDGFSNHSYVVPIEQYAEILDQLDFATIDVQVKYYPHELPSVDQVVEWTKGSVLTAYEKRLPAELFSQFVEDYRERLIETLGEQSPYTYTYKRIFIWAQRSDHE